MVAEAIVVEAIVVEAMTVWLALAEASALRAKGIAGNRETY